MTDIELEDTIRKIFESTLPEGITIADLRKDYNRVFSQMYILGFTRKFYIPENTESVIDFISTEYKIRQALLLAYPIKFKIEYYDLICMALIIPIRENYIDNRGMLKFLMTEIVQTTKDPEVINMGLQCLQEYNRDDLIRQKLLNNYGVNPDVFAMTDNPDNLSQYIENIKNSLGDVEIRNLNFHENSIEFTAVIMVERGYCIYPHGHITIKVNGIKSIQFNTHTLSEFQNGELEISTEKIDNETFVSCAYIHKYTSHCYFKFCGKGIWVSDYKLN